MAWPRAGADTGVLARSAGEVAAGLDATAAGGVAKGPWLAGRRLSLRWLRGREGEMRINITVSLLAARCWRLSTALCLYL